MLIFTNNITARLNYVLNYLFNYRLGINYKTTNNVNNFIGHNGYKINYSDTFFENTLQIIPEGLVFENNIRPIKPQPILINNTPVLFNNQSTIGFDIFSAIFYTIGRYEEYQAFTPDNHQRFCASSSVFAKNNYLRLPVVDIWINNFKTSLLQFYPHIELKPETYKTIPTIDIDSPWSYLHKGFLRNCGGLFKHFVQLNTAKIIERLMVLLRLKPDPFFTFNYLNQLYKTVNLKPIFFIHLGKYGKYDKTINPRKRAFKNFVATLTTQHQTGLHTSYQAANNNKIFDAEINSFTKLTNQKPTRVRQHYLTISIPYYYQNLEKKCTTTDYSMGFADQPGFRAGTSVPFRFFDIEKNTQTNITIVPFAVMERTFIDYLKLDAKQSFTIIKEIIDNCKKVNGTFVSLWHNETLANTFDNNDWRELYKKVLYESLK